MKPASALAVRASDPDAGGRAQPPSGPDVVPQLFDDCDDDDGGNDSLDPNLLFGPRQSGATVLLDVSALGPVIDALKQAPPTLVPRAPLPRPNGEMISLASIELAAPPGGVARRRHPSWTLDELAVMAISFLAVAVPALYFVFAKLI